MNFMYAQKHFIEKIYASYTLDFLKILLEKYIILN